MKQVLICGNYGATNLGDEAILQSILELVAKTWPEAKVQVMSANPGVTAVPMVPAGFRSLLRLGSLRKTWRAFCRADVVLFGGGGLFTDEKPHAIFIWMIQILPAFFLRRPVVCIGQSVGPLRSGWSRWIVRKIFRRMPLVMVRDDASRELLVRLGVVNVQVLPDPVFGLQTGFSAHAVRKPYVVFSLRPWKRGHHELLAKFADWIFEKYHLRSIFVPFQSLHDDDSQEMLQVFSRLQKSTSAEVLPYNENISEVLQLMHEATVVVGMRLHSLIFSTLTATPFLGLSYSQKVTSVVKQLGMEDFLCEYSSLQLETLQKKFEKLFEERSTVEKMLREKQKQFSNEAKKYIELLRAL